jgi:hypothetical protein
LLRVRRVARRCVDLRELESDTVDRDEMLRVAALMEALRARR